jgi:hypothetical protein
LPQPSNAEISRSVPRTPRSVPESTLRRRANTAHVVLAWTPVNDGGTLAPVATQIELEAELETPAATTWVCREASGSGWAEALSSVRCSEVLLTALSDDLPSKHLVFELADLLTLKLAASRPLIRVRFSPPSELTQPRARRRLTHRLNTERKQ